MKPKDLLEDLEKGDRTLEHLQATGKINQLHEINAMNQAFSQAYNQRWYGALSSQLLGQNNIGGGVRW